MLFFIHVVNCHITTKYKLEEIKKMNPITKNGIKSISPHFLSEIIIRIRMKWITRKKIITNIKAISAPPSWLNNKLLDKIKYMKNGMPCFLKPSLYTLLLACLLLKYMHIKSQNFIYLKFRLLQNKVNQFIALPLLCLWKTEIN